MAAIIIGAIASVAALVAARLAFTTLRSPLVRAVIASVFAIPAALAGYHAALGLAHIGAATNGWQQAIAVIVAVIVGATPWSRIRLSTPPEPGQGIAASLTPSIALASAPKDG
jgi:hypothetical protein